MGFEDAEGPSFERSEQAHFRTEGSWQENDSHYGYTVYAEGKSVGDYNGYWVDAMYKEDFGGFQEAELAFWGTGSKEAEIRSDATIVPLIAKTLGGDTETRKSSLEEAALKAKELIESGKDMEQVENYFNPPIDWKAMLERARSRK